LPSIPFVGGSAQEERSSIATKERITERDKNNLFIMHLVKIIILKLYHIY
jgi:hypothetical protein